MSPENNRSTRDTDDIVVLSLVPEHILDNIPRPADQFTGITVSKPYPRNDTEFVEAIPAIIAEPEEAVELEAGADEIYPELLGYVDMLREAEMDNAAEHLLGAYQGFPQINEHLPAILHETTDRLTSISTAFMSDVLVPLEALGVIGKAAKNPLFENIYIQQFYRNGQREFWATASRTINTNHGTFVAKHFVAAWNEQSERLDLHDRVRLYQLHQSYTSLETTHAKMLNSKTHPFKRVMRAILDQLSTN